MQILFINSRNHWVNGWIADAPSQEVAMRALRESGVTVSAIEVASYPELITLLDGVQPDTLLWPNAYYVDLGGGKVAWIQDEIEARNLPYIGQSASVLRTLLHKVDTYKHLEPGGVPLPRYVMIARGEEDQLAARLTAANLTFPLAMKPTSESSSKGVKRVTSLEEALEHAARVFEEFPYSDILLEQWLASEDLTCSYFKLNNEILLIPTYFSSTLMSANHRVREWRLRGDGPGGINPNLAFPPVKDPSFVQQFTQHIPAIVDQVQMESTTRIDCRIDESGVLRYFDVNGMPGLSFQISVVTRQSYVCYPHVEDWAVYQHILNTVVMMAVERFGFTAPQSLRERTLFNLESADVVRLAHQPAAVPQL